VEIRIITITTILKQTKQQDGGPAKNREGQSVENKVSPLRR